MSDFRIGVIGTSGENQNALAVSSCISDGAFALGTHGGHVGFICCKAVCNGSFDLVLFYVIPERIQVPVQLLDKLGTVGDV